MTDSTGSSDDESDDEGDDDDDEVQALLRDAARIDEVSPSLGRLEPGARLGHFEVKAEIGRGAMGIVYLAEDLDLKREVALKILPASVAQDEERRRRLVREARAAAAVSDPNIVVVHEVGEADGRVYVAMERLDGESLRALLSRGPLSIADATDIGTQILHGLGRVHAAGLVHRDLKPDNVMVVGGHRVKLLDFGLARRGESARGSALADTTLLTRDGRILGTPAYMSPEQAVGGEVDARSDLFSAGVVLYEMLGGRRPFVEDRPSELITAILTRAPQPPVALRPEIGEALSRVVLRCLEKDPKDRYPDCESLAGDLARAAASRPPQKRKRTGLRALWIGGSLLSLAIVALAVGRLRTAPRAPDAPPIADVAPPRPMRMVDFPPPASSNQAALTAYATALQKFREADFEEAMAQLDKTIALDPSIGAAPLRRAMFNTRGAIGAELFAKASTRRSTMSARDQALVDAWEPYLARHPPDTATARERMSRLSDASPNDAELALLAGFLDVWWGEDVAAKQQVDRALALDPEFAIASAFKAEWYFQHDDFESALATARDCAARTPAALNCRRDELDVYSFVGRCAELGDRARDALALRHSATELREYVAASLAHQGAAPEALAAAFRGGVPQSDWQGDYEPNARLQVAQYAGDFEAALVEARALVKAADGDPSRARHDGAVGTLIETALEADRGTEAADAGESYLRLRDAYVDDIGGASSGESLALLAMYRAQRIDRAELDRRLDAIAAAWLDRTPRLYQVYIWKLTSGFVVTSRAEAERALASYRPRLVGAWEDSWYLVRYGRALLLAGRVDEALPLFERAARRCDWGLEYLQGILWLGRAREAKGDSKGACDAYGSILDRWAHAKPRSVTADQARRRQVALKCPTKRP
jgi:eukaryotic-like serine/threonine-protein kinase